MFVHFVSFLIYFRLPSEHKQFNPKTGIITLDFLVASLLHDHDTATMGRFWCILGYLLSLKEQQHSVPSIALKLYERVAAKNLFNIGPGTSLL